MHRGVAKKTMSLHQAQSMTQQQRRRRMMMMDGMNGWHRPAERTMIGGIRRHSSSDDSITYSGGQASVGQGGFYGSGGARVLPVASDTNNHQQQQRSKMLALAQDVQTIRSTMVELDMLESLLRGEGATAATTTTTTAATTTSAISSKHIELKNAIKKLMTAPQFIESLNNLEVKGEPAWGLSREERELIIAARGKVNEC